MWPFGKSTEVRLREAIESYDVVKDLPVEVEVRRRTAVFRGSVPREQHARVLEGIAEGIHGIERADVSGLRIEDGAEPEAGGTPTDPSALAKAVHRAVQAERALRDDPVEVLQKGRTVVLRGAVDSEEERAQAVRIAEKVDGVEGVDASGLAVVRDVKVLASTDEAGEVVYEVRAGDTLSEIAQKYYGSGGRDAYMKIAEANGLADPDRIQVGQRLVIPGTPRGPDAVA